MHSAVLYVDTVKPVSKGTWAQRKPVFSRKSLQFRGPAARDSKFQAGV